jgi:polyribonucleotide nucleotidyltransferase
LDETIDPAVLGINAASAALMLTGSPFEGPIAAVRVGRVDGKLVANPTYEETGRSTLDLLIAGTEESITMWRPGQRKRQKKS